jgi:hypothetical protein
MQNLQPSMGRICCLYLNMFLNPKHEARNPKQGSKSEIQMFKTNPETRILLNPLAIQRIKVTGMEIANLVFVIETFDI